VYSRPKPEQNAGNKGETKDLKEVNDNIRKAQDDEPTGTAVDPKTTGNKPRFDRDR
jgi:hypothetical protein